jgi:hypothetical protein
MESYHLTLNNSLWFNTKKIDSKNLLKAPQNFLLFNPFNQSADF